MQISRVPQAALALLVLTVAGVAPQIANSGATTLGTTGPSGPTGSSGESGATGTSGASGSTGSTGATGGTGSTGSSGSTGATGSTSPSGGATPAAPATAAGTPAGTTATGPSGPTGATGSEPSKPDVTSVSIQPASGATLLSNGTSNAGVSAGGVVAGGAVAPAPSLFSGADPLSGVLPGSVFDPFVSAALGADIPQWYVEHFDVPAFLLPIYQSAGAAYDVPWEVLAAINQVETDYGTDLNVSSAGAVGWMQFLPSTWQGYGMDATGSGVADPYNAADAIFSAANYLNAAGAATNLPQAIFAYNHSTAYVQSVLLRAELLSGVPATLANSVSELAEGLFPIELRYHPYYRNVAESTERGETINVEKTIAGGAEAPAPSAVSASVETAKGQQRLPAAEIFASRGAAAVAVQEGTVVAIGHTRALGTYIRLEDSFGNRYTYGNLGSVAAYHLIAKPQQASVTASTASPSDLASGAAPTAPASAGDQSASGLAAAAAAAATKAQLAASEDTGAGNSASVADAGTAPFATFDLHPATPSLLIFGGLQARRGSSLHGARERAIVDRYYTSAFGLPRDQLEPRPLRVGARVLAGTILGYLKADRSSEDPHLIFELRPAGADQAPSNPRPFLDAWTQIATLELHRKALGDPLYGPDLQSTDAGDALAMSQIDLERVVLDDGRLKIAMCERRAIAAGGVDRRVLATIEFLVDSGLDPTVSGAQCLAGQSRSASSPAPAMTDSVTITAINSTPVAGNQGTGTPTDRAIRALLTIPGANAPAQIASLETIPGAAGTVADPSDADKIVVSFAPATTPVALASTAAYSRGFTLGTTRWAQLDAQLLAITQPRVPTVISTLALRTTQSTNSTK